MHRQMYKFIPNLPHPSPSIMESLRMLLLSLLVFGCLSGALGSSKLCQLLAHKACHSETLTGDIPETKEELNKTCAKVQEINECITNDLKTCRLEDEKLGSDDRDWLEIRNVGLNVRLPLCNLDPDTNPNILSSISCIKKLFKANFRESPCREAVGTDIAALQNRQVRLLQSENATVISLYDDCLYRLLTRNCLINLHYKKCGSDARDVAFQMMMKLEDWDEVCPLDIRIDVLELLDDLSSLKRNEIYVKDYIKTDDIFL